MGTTDELENWVGALIDECQAHLTKDPALSRPPSVIYHLTDSDGLHGIVTTQTIRASLATGLNDALEVQYGMLLAREIAGARARRSPAGYAAELMANLVNPGRAPPEIRYEMFPFVASFCGRVDRSGQWLHYGRSGHGFAVGFSPDLAQEVSYDLIPILYTPESQKMRLTGLVEIGERALGSDNADPRKVRAAAHIVALFVPQHAVRMKHPSFADEEEWRLVAHELIHNGKRKDQTQIKYKTSDGRLVPYQELSFANARQLLKEVVVGYSCSSTPDAVQLLAQDHDMNPVVTRSGVPVR